MSTGRTLLVSGACLALVAGSAFFILRQNQNSSQPVRSPAGRQVEISPDDISSIEESMALVSTITGREVASLELGEAPEGWLSLPGTLSGRIAALTDPIGVPFFRWALGELDTRELDALFQDSGGEDTIRRAVLSPNEVDAELLLRVGTSSLAEIGFVPDESALRALAAQVNRVFSLVSTGQPEHLDLGSAGAEFQTIKIALSHFDRESRVSSFVATTGPGAGASTKVILSGIPIADAPGESDYFGNISRRWPVIQPLGDTLTFPLASLQADVVLNDGRSAQIKATLIYINEAHDWCLFDLGLMEPLTVRSFMAGGAPEPMFELALAELAPDYMLLSSGWRPVE